MSQQTSQEKTQKPLWALAYGTVVTMDAQRRVIPEGAVVVSGTDIVAVGPASEVLPRYPEADVLDVRDHLVIPGLINAHTHVPMSILRGLVDDQRLDVWLLGYMMPIEREFVDPEFVRWGTLLSCLEMIRGGITTFCDMYYFEDQVATAAAEAGMRAICGQTILKFPSPDAQSYDESLAYARDFIQKWKGHELITPAVAPHAPYTATDDMMRQCLELALEFDVPVHIHLSETRKEVEDNYRERGLPPILWAETLDLFRARVIAAHCVHIEEREMRVLAGHRAGVAHNPTSNLKLASGVAPVVQMRKAGIAVGIGTDGPASNNDQDLFEEMRLAALLPKGMLGDPTALPAQEAFAMATIEGARALHLDHIIGSLEPGKRADIVVLAWDGPHAWPHHQVDEHNVYSHLVYTAHAGDVRHVWINGRQVLRDGEVLTVDAERVYAETQQIAERIGQFLQKREASLLDKLLAIGGLERSETFEIQVKARITNPAHIEQVLQNDPDIEIVKHTVRQQYDTYFLFNGRRHGIIRYREDNVIRTTEERGALAPLDVEPIYTLTLLGPTHEREYGNSIILSRSRFTAPAVYSLRFYREYFQPTQVREVVKWRNRYRIRYKGVDFAVNIDKLSKPAQEISFLEIKSRTWSQEDALRKAGLATELLEKFGIRPEALVRGEYVDLAD